jgi:hypothetical protein
VVLAPCEARRDRRSTKGRASFAFRVGRGRHVEDMIGVNIEPSRRVDQAKDELGLIATMSFFLKVRQVDFWRGGRGRFIFIYSDR